MKDSNLLIPKSVNTKNYDNKEISIEYVVLHYTACDLNETLNIFTNLKASAHLVVDFDGAVYEVVQCWNKPVLRAWHAGDSKFTVDNKFLSGFNDFSLGIELVNFNGNIFDYTEDQYNSLKIILDNFINRFPVLKDPKRVLGHEHIAGFRGKCDPGTRFDWSRLYKTIYNVNLNNECLISNSAAKSLKDLADFAPKEANRKNDFFKTLSLLTENLLSK
jgi:N-acetylmuramoyl-L-alanine amidase